MESSKLYNALRSPYPSDYVKDVSPTPSQKSLATATHLESAQRGTYRTTTTCHPPPLPQIHRLRLCSSSPKPKPLADFDMYTSVFPQLKALGWQTEQTTGNGDCFFNAVSIQMVGGEVMHAMIRRNVVEHMRANKQLYSAFTVPELRRSTRVVKALKSAPGTSSVVHGAGYWDQYLQKMERIGTWADHTAMQAYCDLYESNLVVFQEAGRGRTIRMHPAHIGERNDKPVQYIAYHAYEHYSSVAAAIGPLPSTLEAFDAVLRADVSERSQSPTPSLQTDSGSSQATTDTTDSDAAMKSILSRDHSARKRRRVMFSEDDDGVVTVLAPPSKLSKSGLKRIRIVVNEDRYASAGVMQITMPISN